MTKLKAEVEVFILYTILTVGKIKFSYAEPVADKLNLKYIKAINIDFTRLKFRGLIRCNTKTSNSFRPKFCPEAENTEIVVISLCSKHWQIPKSCKTWIHLYIVVKMVHYIALYFNFEPFSLNYSYISTLFPYVFIALFILVTRSTLSIFFLFFDHISPCFVCPLFLTKKIC